MRHTNFALALLAAAALTACGGSSNNSSTPAAKPTFAAQISFGDSLSDVGTHQVGGVLALGGGKYTINGNNIDINPALHGKNWTELMAAQMGLAAPCPATKGLEGTGINAVPPVNFALCFSYAQGGSRVTNPIGPHNKVLNPALGQLTYPLVKQVANHLAKAGSFKATDIVYVLAGGNDALILTGGLTAAATAEGNKKFASSLTLGLAAKATNPATAAQAIGAAVAAAAAKPGATSNSIVAAAIPVAASQPGASALASQTVWGPIAQQAGVDAAAAGAAYGAANGPALLPQMAAAGTELGALIRTQIVGKGATHVVVVNLPDLASSPSAKSQPASSQQLIGGMVQGFNIALRAGLDGLDSQVLYVDLYSASVDQVANPTKYGITNALKPACGPNDLGGASLVCNRSNVLPGVDVSHYLFADDVHPAPYGQTLIAKLVAEALVARGWL